MVNGRRSIRQAKVSGPIGHQAVVVYLVTVAMLVSGCAVGPNYFRPSAPPPPEEWIEGKDPGLTGDLPEYGEWWKVFNDPLLNSLIEEACAQNLTLRSAGLRVLEARAQRLIAIGSFFPQTQEATADYSRNLMSQNLFMDNRIEDLGVGESSRTSNIWAAGFDALWELDFWGRFRRAIEAASAELDASVYNYDDILISLVAEVAATYVQIRTFEQRLEVAKENVKLQKGTLKLTETRFKFGAVTELDVEQARTNLTNTQALVPEFEMGLRQSRNALCVLIGIPPCDIQDVLGGPQEIPAAPAEVAVGIPAALLRRRPDVRRAEREVAAQSARIGVAVSELYPHIMLKGSIGVESDDFNNLWQDLSLAGSVGPSIRWDILNYGRLVNKARVQNIRTQQLIANYQNTVLNAYSETEDAIAAYLREQERARYLSGSVDAARRAVDISLIQYRDGMTDFIRVLDSQSFLSNQQDNLVVSRGNVALDLIALHKALGGGWEIRLRREFVPEETKEDIRSRLGWKKGWWPRLRLGWPFNDKPRKDVVVAIEQSVPEDDQPDDEELNEESTDEPFTNINFQRLPIRLDQSEPDAEGNTHE